MGRFNRDNNRGRERFSDGARGNRFSGRGGGRRDMERAREMHEVTCDNCGKRCKVPFNPTGDKPVYCSECFDKKGNSSNRNSNSNNDSSEQLDQINFKLDKIMLILQSLELDTGEEAEDEDNDYEEE